MFVVIVALFQVSVASSKVRVGLLSTEDSAVPSQQSYSFELFALSPAIQTLADEIDELRLDVVYDLSYSEMVSSKVSLLSKTMGFTHILEWSEASAAKRGALYPHLSREGQLDAGVAVLKALSIAEIVFLSDEFKVSEKFKREFDVVAEVVVAEETPQTSLNKIIARTFKPEAVRTVVLDLPSELAAKTFSSLHRAHMMDESYAIICSPQTAWLDPYSKIQGPLLLLEEGTETASTSLESKLLSLDWAVRRLSSSCSITMRACLSEAFAARKLKLLNLLGGGRTEVGEVLHSQVVLTKQILYPGNKTSFDPTAAIEINISTISSGQNPNDYDTWNPLSFVAFFAALNEATQNKFLGRFVVKAHEIACGASEYSLEFATACMKREKSSLGVAIFAPYIPEATLGVLQAMKALNITQPLIGTNQTKQLSSKTTWPSYVTVTQPNTVQASGVVQFLVRYGYTKVNFFYSDDMNGQDYSQYMRSGLAANRIEIVNPEAEWAVSADFLLNPSKYKQKAQSVADSGIRPVIFVGLPKPKNPFVDLLYEVGLRTDDVLLLQFIDAYFEHDPTMTEEQDERRKSLLMNSFVLMGTVFNGPDAERIRALISKAYYGWTAHPLQCLFYDTNYLLMYALKAMILRGKDYEDTSALNFQVRDTAFYGCSGRVSIDKDSNDRRDQEVDIYNSVDVEGHLTLVLVGRFSVARSTLFTDFKAPLWPGGKTPPPKVSRLNFGECPFPEEYRYDFEDGKDLVLALSMSYIVFTCLIAVILLWSRRLKNSVEMMTSKVQVTFQDRLVLLLVAVDCLQYIGHGPLLKNNEDIFSNLVDYASGGTISAIKFKEGVYWIVLNSLLSMVLFWFIFCVFLWMKYKGNRLTFARQMASLGEAVMPLLGNALFLPITSVIFDVFVCEEAHGPVQSELEYGDSFMFRDCSEDCWDGAHFRYVVVAAIALVMYLPITVVTRPLWQELIPDINVKTRQTFYLQKSLVEVVLIGIRRGLRSSHSLTHGVIYVIVILLHMTLCFIHKPFNYPRLNLWFSLSMFMTAVVGVVSLFENNVDSFTQQDALGVFVGVAAVVLGKGYAVLGLLTQLKCFPKLLLDPGLPYLPELFRFAFDFRSVAPIDAIKHRKLNFVNQPEEEKVSRTGLDKIKTK
jgi:ABC-type branched-subunit amino acid transport system substrate-binding protein